MPSTHLHLTRFPAPVIRKACFSFHCSEQPTGGKKKEKRKEKVCVFFFFKAKQSECVLSRTHVITSQATSIVAQFETVAVAVLLIFGVIAAIVRQLDK